MTLGEFEKNWQKYAIVKGLRKDSVMMALKDVFGGCKKLRNELFFSVKRGIACIWIIKCDEGGFCYRRMADNDSWQNIGRLVLLEELEKNPKFIKRLECCAKLFWLKAGGY